jgi:hypothetical protein
MDMKGIYTRIINAKPEHPRRHARFQPARRGRVALYNQCCKTDGKHIPLLQ